MRRVRDYYCGKGGVEMLSKEEREALRLAFGSGQGNIIRNLHAALDDIDELHKMLREQHDALDGGDCKPNLDERVKAVLDD